MTRSHIYKVVQLKAGRPHIPIPSFQGEKSNLQRETGWVERILIPGPRLKQQYQASFIFPNYQSLNHPNDRIAI